MLYAIKCDGCTEKQTGLIETNNILINKVRVDPGHFFQFTDSGYSLRGHCMKLYKPSIILNE